MNAKKAKQLRRAAMFDPNTEREHVVKRKDTYTEEGGPGGKPIIKEGYETTVRNHPQQSRALYQQLKRVAKR